MKPPNTRPYPCCQGSLWVLSEIPTVFPQFTDFCGTEIFIFQSLGSRQSRIKADLFKLFVIFGISLQKNIHFGKIQTFLFSTLMAFLSRYFFSHICCPSVSLINRRYFMNEMFRWSMNNYVSSSPNGKNPWKNWPKSLGCSL